MLKSEDYTYLKRLVKADIADMEETEPKSKVGRQIAMEYRRKLLKTLERLTS